jgi:HD-GYP domain-containing protein (c-di-GMP phosphodiesterase class II)
MLSAREHANRLSSDEGLAELRRRAGSQFDPAVVDAFCAVMARVGLERAAAA